METIPNLNYKITALEQTLNAAPLQAAEDDFHGQDFNISYDHVSFAYQTAQKTKSSTILPLWQRQDKKLPWLVNPALERVPLQNC